MARILVFDSGVGGLSILRALQRCADLQQQPHQWLFCSDNAFFPYGTKKEDELIARVTVVLNALQNQVQPDIIVLACNTASTVALESVRSTLQTPVVGVVPAIKPAAQLSQTRSIGILATPGTINRPYTQKLIDDFASDCHITRVGSSELVWIAEQYLRTGMVDNTELHRILAPMRDAIAQSKLDTIVLACTHFPLIIEFLSEQLPEIRHWVDSGDAIARRVAWCLQQQEAQPSPPTTSLPSNIALFTRLDENVKALERALGYFDLTDIQALNLPPGKH
jgi:glutamate racemase